MPTNKVNRNIPLLLAEMFTLILLILSILTTLIFDVHFYLFDFKTLLFIWQHYLGPFVIAAIMAGYTIRLRHGATFINPGLPKFYLIRLFIAFHITIYLHFNFKLWSLLINPNNFDIFYQNSDNTFPLNGIKSIFLNIHQTLNLGWLDKINAYHLFFIGLFIASFIIAALNKNQLAIIHITTATIIVLGLGGMLYSAAPAIGPFINCAQNQCPLLSAQTDMLNFYPNFITSHGADYERRNFVMAPAAMPSLHIANALVFLYFAFYYFKKRIRIVFLMLFVFFLIEAVALRWHYVIDIIPGIILAGISIYVTTKSNIAKIDKPSVTAVGI